MGERDVCETKKQIIRKKLRPNVIVIKGKGYFYYDGILCKVKGNLMLSVPLGIVTQIRRTQKGELDLKLWKAQDERILN